MRLRLANVTTGKKSRVKIFNEDGNLKITGKKLVGDYQYDWRGKDGKVRKATERFSFSLRIVK